MDEIRVSCDPSAIQGAFYCGSALGSSGWARLEMAALAIDPGAVVGSGRITLPWYQCLTLFREMMALQQVLKFRFAAEPPASEHLRSFLRQMRQVAAARQGASARLDPEAIEARLHDRGWDRSRRQLRSFQLRDLALLTALASGANFSVPGAGKTTVTLAIHLLTMDAEDSMLVIGPKSAFPAWEGVIEECMKPTSGVFYGGGSFCNVSGLSLAPLQAAMDGNARYYVTNYEHFVALQDYFGHYLATRSVHLVLDEAHRMKAGLLSQRGAAMLRVSNLPKRKDILTGTPMPQGPTDLDSQITFLWPGSDLGARLSRGAAPRDVISGLYARTTKTELGLPPVTRSFWPVPMSGPQLGLYGVVRSEALRQLSSFRSGGADGLVRARRSVMRLLQLASNPAIAVRALAEETGGVTEPMMQAVLDAGISSKMQKAVELARSSAMLNRKSVIWTVFTQNIHDLEAALADLNPVTLFGETPVGRADEPGTREYNLARFHSDNGCLVLIANPAAAGEGISLHSVCHEAIYVDRSYVSTHYLQSIDRIHRLGLAADVVTNVHIIQCAPPAGLGSIDYSVSRRLAGKIRALQQLLDDPDLHAVALDEENAGEPVDYEVDLDDVVDLIAELEGQRTYEPDHGV